MGFLMNLLTGDRCCRYTLFFLAPLRHVILRFAAFVDNLLGAEVENVLGQNGLCNPAPHQFPQLGRCFAAEPTSTLELRTVRLLLPTVATQSPKHHSILQNGKRATEPTSALNPLF